MLNKNKLRARMVEVGYTQDKLAKETGISYTSLSRKMNGVTSFDVDEADRICEVLGIVAGVEKAEIFLA